MEILGSHSVGKLWKLIACWVGTDDVLVGEEMLGCLSVQVGVAIAMAGMMYCEILE